MLKIAVVGLGVMGREHLVTYEKLAAEGMDLKVVAVCDIWQQRLDGIFAKGDQYSTLEGVDITKFARYLDFDEMIEKEELDYIDITMPTFLHAKYAVKALNAGKHVLCEKPMAMNVDECEQMIAAQKASGKYLMVAQCLRFWPMYVKLKEYTSSGEFGRTLSGSFFRGGSPPKWSWENWLLTGERSGGALLDQHVHDVDMVNYLYGLPNAVSTSAITAIDGSISDTVSTNYYYDDNKVINAQDDWFMGEKANFGHIYRVNFEKATVLGTVKGVKVYPREGEAYDVEVAPGAGYYYEMKEYTAAIINGTGPLSCCTPESTRDTIRIANAEQLSAKNKGALTPV